MVSQIETELEPSVLFNLSVSGLVLPMLGPNEMAFSTSVVITLHFVAV